jgi:hypothetical protein
MKSTISSKTTRINQLVKHYNQLARRMESLDISHYQNGMQNSYEKTVKQISDEMASISSQIYQEQQNGGDKEE